MPKHCVTKTRQIAPLIHCITNYVTVNDVANVLLACGASPIMADDVDEVEEITALCSGLYINIGTLSRRTIPAMSAAMRQAAKMNIPMVLDPVGVGASKLRTNTALDILRDGQPTVIRANMSELKALVSGSENMRGVDAAPKDTITEENLPQAAQFIKEAAARTKTITAVTSIIDVVSDGENCYAVRNGRAEMSRVTGTGCQLSALVAAYLAANRNDATKAVLAAVIVMGLSGEIAAKNMLPHEGNSTYRNRIIDAVYNMDEETFVKGARYEKL